MSAAQNQSPEEITRVWLLIKIGNIEKPVTIAGRVFNEANRHFARISYKTGIVRADVVINDRYNLVVPFFTDEKVEYTEESDNSKPLQAVGVDEVIDKIRQIIIGAGGEIESIDSAVVDTHTPKRTPHGEGYVTRPEVNSPGRGRTPQGHNPW